MKRRGEAERGVDTSPEERDRSGGNVDPTGHVSSGLQTGPLRAGDERPVASTDEAMRQARPERSAGGEVAGEELRAGESDVTSHYLKRRPDEADRSGDDAS